jgi:hypothetical protein
VPVTSAATAAAALALLAAAAPPADDWRIEAPLSVTASAPSSSFETTLVPWAGLRAGRSFFFGDGAAEGGGPTAGFDLALHLGGGGREGTPQVEATRALGVLEGRALFSPARLSSTFSALTPYGFAGALVGGGAVETVAFEEKRLRGLATFGLRVGGGLELRVHRVITRVELGAGVRDLRFEVSSAVAVGLAL